MKRIGALMLTTFLTILLMGCWSSHEIESTHKVESIHEVKPIHIVIDINLKVDKALDNYFGDIDAAEGKIEKTNN